MEPTLLNYPHKKHPQTTRLLAKETQTFPVGDCLDATQKQRRKSPENVFKRSNLICVSFDLDEENHIFF